ncbi:uncharacterized protein [Haliotis asinina]|uniref:uncharacterized protein n=1 Tax=Haliotis asinina TaxID=109174 RepID=UPI003531C09A
MSIFKLNPLNADDRLPLLVTESINSPPHSKSTPKQVDLSSLDPYSSQWVTFDDTTLDTRHTGHTVTLPAPPSYGNPCPSPLTPPPSQSLPLNPRTRNPSPSPPPRHPTHRDPPPSHTLSTLSRAINCSRLPLPMFDGKDPIAASAWLKRYEKFASAQHYTDDDHIDIFPLYLTHLASEWYEGTKDTSCMSWPELRAAFLRRYSPSSISLLTRHNALLDRKQRSGETFPAFLQSIRHEAELLHRNDDGYIKDLILRNSLPHIRQFILTHPHDSLDQIIESAEIADATSGLTDSKSEQLMAAINALSSQVSALHTEHVNAITPGYHPHQITHPGMSGTASKNYSHLNANAHQRPFPYRSNPSQYHQQSVPAPKSFPRGGPQHQPPKQFRCKGCGYFHSSPQECRAQYLRCYNCNQLGHLLRTCSLPQQRRA